jgi:hypothetical protein
MANDQNLEEILGLDRVEFDIGDRFLCGDGLHCDNIGNYIDNIHDGND